MSMKILIAEDMEDLLEILEAMIQDAYPGSHVYTALNGKIAIDWIDQNPDVDLVVSDFNMPNKNGADVYKALRAKNQQASFVLVSTEIASNHADLKVATNFGQVFKPFTEQTLLDGINKVLSESVKSGGKRIENRAAVETYTAISVHMAKKIGRLNSPLYVKLSDGKFVKILNAGVVFDEIEVDRFERKKIEKLWVEKSQLQNFFGDYKKQVLSAAAWQELNSTEVKEKLAVDHESIAHLGRTFGWTPEVISVANQTINNVMKFIEYNPDLNQLLRDSRNNTRVSHLSNHSVMLSIFCSAILEKMKLKSNMAREKLTFACLLHDITIAEEVFVTKLTALYNSSTQEIEQEKTEEMQAIINHPLIVAEMLMKWQLCPPDVDVIVRQHHERPDGTGFPLGLNALQIFPLAAVMILAEDVLFQMYNDSNLKPKDYLLSKEDYYNRGEFRAVYTAVMESI